jgi:hypothetical protein
MEQSIVHLLDESREVREVAEMGRLLLDLLPEELNRVEIRRLGGQLEDGQARGVRGEELLGGLPGVILGAILNEDQRFPGLGQHLS